MLEKKIGTSKKTPNRKKASDSVRLVLPIFLTLGKGDGKIPEMRISRREMMNGVALHGDFSKREGCKYAQAWADKNRKQTCIAEIVVSLGKKRIQGAARMDEEMIASGEYGMVRLEKYSLKIGLYKKIEAEIEAEAARRYPHARKNKSIDDWMSFDPSIARVLFDLFPVDVVIVNSATPYTPKGASVTVAVIRDPSSIAEMTVLYGQSKINLVP